MNFFFITIYICLALPFTIFCRDYHTSSPQKINLISNNNGVGLETDCLVMKEVLEMFGHSVEGLNWHRKEPVLADINIFFEYIVPEKMSWAKVNYFIPNPEWFMNDLELLDRFDLVLCRTREVERIFQNYIRKPIF